MLHINWCFWMDAARSALKQPVGSDGYACAVVPCLGLWATGPARDPSTPVNQWGLDELQACDVTVAVLETCRPGDQEPGGWPGHFEVAAFFFGHPLSQSTIL